jgi:SAM-dependent methyltransferase
MHNAERRSRGYRRFPASGKFDPPRQQDRASQSPYSDHESATTPRHIHTRPKGPLAVDVKSDWLAFWDSSLSTFVNARHKDVHYCLIAQQIAALMPTGGARVLDYGSGEALHADRVAAVAGELFLCDAAPRLLGRVTARFAGHPKIRAVTPQEVGLFPDHSLDLVVLHSVVQYLTLEQTGALFVLFSRLLKSGGVLMVSDVIPPHVSAATDALALLKFSGANGFLTATLVGLARSLFSDYRRLRARIGLARYSEGAMIEKLGTAGFVAHRAPENIGDNQARMAFMARTSRTSG